MIEVRVGGRGEIVIPKRLRERYGIKPHSTIVIREGTDGIEINTQSMEDAVTEVYRRWAKIRQPINPDIIKKALAMEPYEDEE